MKKKRNMIINIKRDKIENVELNKLRMKKSDMKKIMKNQIKIWKKLERVEKAIRERMSLKNAQSISHTDKQQFLALGDRKEGNCQVWGHNVMNNWRVQCKSVYFQYKDLCCFYKGKSTTKRRSGRH